MCVTGTLLRSVLVLVLVLPLLANSRSKRGCNYKEILGSYRGIIFIELQNLRPLSLLKGASHPGLHPGHDAAGEVSAEQQAAVRAGEATGEHGAAHCQQLPPGLSGDECVLLCVSEDTREEEEEDEVDQSRQGTYHLLAEV